MTRPSLGEAIVWALCSIVGAAGVVGFLFAAWIVAILMGVE